MSTESADELDVRLGAVIVAWNALAQFFPYFDVVATNWDADLRETLGRAVRDGDERAFATTLDLLVEHLDDGHGEVRHPRLRPRDGVLPIAVAWVEDQLLITASSDDQAPVGSRILQVAGRAAADWQRAQEATVSGSPQWKRRRATGRLLYGAVGTTAELRLADAAGRQRSITVTRIARKDQPHERSGPPIRSLSDGIYYVDLDRASWAAIRARLPDLAGAAGVVFDLRGYPNANHQILSHPLRANDDHVWMFVPQLSHPRSVEPPSWQAEGWELEAKQPHIAGRVAFLTDSRAASYAESVIGFVDGYQLGAIVGGPTAGANGNTKVVPLPGEFSLWSTGMKVLRHDGTRLHGVGIPPSHPAEPTIAGVRAGRDDVLDAALELLRKTWPRELNSWALTAGGIELGSRPSP